MKRRSSRLRPLVELAGRDGRDATEQLARSFTELARSEKELAQVRGYLDEYRSRLEAGAGVGPGRLENDRNFVARLTEVVDVAARKLESTRARHEAAVAEWRRAHRHDLAMQTLLETCRRRELAELDRREADAVDELVLRWLGPGPS